MTGKSTTPAADTKAVAPGADTKVIANTMQEKEFVDRVMTRIDSMQKTEGLQLPRNYSAINALNAAMLILRDTKDRNDKLVLQGACTQESIYYSLLNMVTQGLNPMKKQCYFIPYGNQLTLMKSYLGDIAVAKRIKGVKDVKYYALYEGDEFETEFNIDTGVLRVTKYAPKFDNIDISKVTGAFAIVVGEDGPLHTEVMTMAQIKRAWEQGAAKGKSGAHTNFTEEMVKKTVVHRCCKQFINTSDDSDLIVSAYNDTRSEMEDEGTPGNSTMINAVEYEVQEEVRENANNKKLDIQPEQNKKAPKEDHPRNANEQGQVTMGGPGF
jgi:recombination protein RecT